MTNDLSRNILKIVNRFRQNVNKTYLGRMLINPGFGRFIDFVNKTWGMTFCINN